MRNLSIQYLQGQYSSGKLTPAQLVEELVGKLADSDPAIWITRVTPEALRTRARELMETGPGPDRPLWGVPFAVKDNIDVAGLPTTAACPDFAYMPEADSHAVRCLLEAGAILIGKTNLDQFATGLVGTRSPYGVPDNAVAPGYIPGGSSSGSAVAVARHLVSFALGTDTAGSGRVPAAFNNLVGLKPTRGLVSCAGVVPACRSLDCISVFAHQAADAAIVLDVIDGYDCADAMARFDREPQCLEFSAGLRLAVPLSGQLEFFGDEQAAAAWRDSVRLLQQQGAEVIEVDFAPLFEAARLLYGGPWVAERYLATRELLENSPESMLSVTRGIIAKGNQPLALDAFESIYRLSELRARAREIWDLAPVAMTPTAGTIYTVDEIAEDPVGRNTNLGYYTNFMNLLDYCAVAAPTAWRADNLPFGVTFFAPANSDRGLLALAARVHHAAATGMGVLREAVSHPDVPTIAAGEENIDVIVCGAHMRGLPLNHQLTSRGAAFIGAAETASGYRIYRLPPTGRLPERPGLVRTGDPTPPIPVEVWRMPISRFGGFVREVLHPLGIGQVDLADGRRLHGFLCEQEACRNAPEIDGGWRRYLDVREG